MNNIVLYALLMLLAGLGIPLMAALNGALGVKLQSPALAATILLTVGLFVAACYLLLVEGLPKNISSKNIPWYLFCGGFFVMFYILSITKVAPLFGVANAVAFVLLGQLIAMSVIDHYGLINNIKYVISYRRALGLILMTIGVFMVLSRPANA